MNDTTNIATLILAAGNSSRMGQPKQLLPWKNSTLIETVIDTALNSNAKEIVVITGANHNVISENIERYPVEILQNNNWQKGLGNSIACGVHHLTKKGSYDGVLIVLGDQPLITSSFLNDIISKFKSGNKTIVATEYVNGKKGVPVLFDSCYFDELSKLDGDKGAKVVLDTYSEHIKTIKGHDLVLDIDTKEDYQELKKYNDLS